LKPVEDLDGRTYRDGADATEALRQAIEAANRNVVAQAQSDPALSGMGTTLTATMVRDGSLHLAHVGDSRAYLLRGREEITQLTTDHTLVEQLVQEGRLSRDEIATHPQRSVVTRAIGVDREVEVDTLPPLVLEPGDQVLLCSDGLSGPVVDSELAEILNSTDDGDEAVRRLLAAANDRGGPDNITVVLLRAESGEDADDQPTEAIAAAVSGSSGGGGARAAAGGGGRSSIAIRTRPDSDGHDFATDFSRYGARAGVAAPAPERGGRVKRVLAVLLSAIVLLAVLGGGGWLLLSRAWFLGDLGGDVAIFRGLPQQVVGIDLFRVAEVTGPAVNDLDPRIRARLAEGITVASQSEAKATIDEWQAQVDDAAEPAATSPRRPGRTNPSESP
ncbi:MAG: serine/threonine-protein phosphatase, partial [Euzebyaceae bacterium]|nr:serine/threonine-protein phosphatase [Euzebyaceae bacterium]